MAQRRKLLYVVAVAFASATTAHAQAPVDVGGTFQQIEQAANAWIPAIMQEASFLFYVLATPGLRLGCAATAPGARLQRLVSQLD